MYFYEPAPKPFDLRSPGPGNLYSRFCPGGCRGLQGEGNPTPLTGPPPRAIYPAIWNNAPHQPDIRYNLIYRLFRTPILKYVPINRPRLRPLTFPWENRYATDSSEDIDNLHFVVLNLKASLHYHSIRLRLWKEKNTQSLLVNLWKILVKYFLRLFYLFT